MEKRKNRLKKVKLGKHKFDKLVKGYKPIYRTLDSGGNTLTFIVHHKGYKTEHNTLLQARIMASKIK